MSSEKPQIPWPTYEQWSTESILIYGLGAGAWVGAYSLLSYWQVKMTWFHYLGIFIVGLIISYLPLLPITILNWQIQIRWSRKIGHRTTWKGLWKIIETEPSKYELIVKRIFTGYSSFGTYNTLGGWNSYILRNKDTGKLWVVSGNRRLEYHQYGIEVEIL